MKSLALTAGIAALGLSSCQTPAPPEYTVSRDSLFYLQQLPKTQVSVGSVTDSASRNSEVRIPRSKIICPASVEDDVAASASAYIQKALIKELDTAGLYSSVNSTVRIDGVIEELSIVRSLPFNATWTIALRLRSTNGAEVTTIEQHRFDLGSLAGANVCDRAMQNFEPAVRAVIERAIRTEDFRSLLILG